MTKCYDCEFFRYFNKSDIETIVNCDLMFEYYQVSIEKRMNISEKELKQFLMSCIARTENWKNWEFLLSVVMEMSEKRFVIDEEGISDNKTDNWYCWKEEVVDLLNEQDRKIRQLEKVNEDLREVNKENQLLHEENVKQCEKWRNLYELKDKEVTARVDGLNKVCNYYLNEVLFKSDTDPNKAVKEVINEILNTPIYKE